ncbi:MAG TPA: hypothetical protein VFK66_10485 [Oryzihumus sp.]|nr:hypothetical protein [Oryzihumus sp.]
MNDPVPELHHLVRSAIRLRLDLDVLLRSATHGRLDPDLVRALAPAVLAVMGYEETTRFPLPTEGEPATQMG